MPAFDINTVLLFSDRSLPAEMISTFSAKQRLHLLVVFWYSVALCCMLHWMCSMPWSFSAQTCFDNDVMLRHLLSLIECWCELYRCLKVCAVSRCIVLFIIRHRHGRLIHHWLYLALAVQRAVVLYSAIARLSTNVVLAHNLPDLQMELLCCRITADMFGIQL